MKLRWMSEVRQSHPEYSPRCEARGGDLLLENAPYNRAYHAVVCAQDGAPLYDLPARAEPQGALVLPMDRRGRVGLLEQWRVAPAAQPWQSPWPVERLDRHGIWSLELPRGFPEPGEGAADAARREVAEELGARALRLWPLGWINQNTTFSLTDLPLFAALVEPLASPAANADPHEVIRGVSWVAPEALPALIGAGKIRCGVTLAVLAWALAARSTLAALAQEPARPHPLCAHLGDAGAFLEAVVVGLWARGISPEGLRVDHVCYRAADDAAYLRLRAALLSEGVLLGESMIKGRPIANFALASPLRAGLLEVNCVELAAPHPGKRHPEGLEHVEILVDEPIDAFVARHAALPWARGEGEAASLSWPGVKVKLLRRPLAETIAEERATGAAIPVPADFWSGQEPR
jgi:predicted metalloenzyme YecM/8-oxo-dGTP pyrophosphatase MutT (NUDIX family)